MPTIRKINLYNKEVYRNILSHVRNFNFITVHQCANMFYFTSKNDDYEARRTLNRLVKSGQLKKYRQGFDSQSIYYMYDYPNVGKHEIILMDFYSLFIRYGMNIEHFQTKELEFCDRKIRLDGLIEFSFPEDNNIYSLLIEVDCTHPTTIERLEKLYDSGEVQEMFKDKIGAEDFLPDIVIITDRPNRKQSEYFNIIYLDHKLSDFVNKIYLEFGKLVET